MFTFLSSNLFCKSFAFKRVLVQGSFKRADILVNAGYIRLSADVPLSYSHEDEKLVITQNDHGSSLLELFASEGLESLSLKGNAEYNLFSKQLDHLHCYDESTVFSQGEIFSLSVKDKAHCIHYGKTMVVDTLNQARAQIWSVGNPILKSNDESTLEYSGSKCIVLALDQSVQKLKTDNFAYMVKPSEKAKVEMM